MHITPEQHAEVVADREFLRDFFDNAPDMFVSVDADTGCIKACNRSLCDALAREQGELIGASIFDVYHPSCHLEARRVLEEFRSEGEAASNVLSFRTADGTALPISLRVSAVRDATGKILYSSSICRDLTLVRENEALRLEARVQKSQRLESLAVLAGGIAHDFNNLLVGILGNAGLALMTLPNESPIREVLQDIETAALRAADLTKQMLAYSGKGRFQVELVDLTKLVAEMSHLLEVGLSSNVVLRLDLGEPGPVIEADATQIRQVVMNLITNGSDAIGDRSGLVTIRTGLVEVSAEYLDSMTHGVDAEPGYYGFVEVSDTGVGMSPDVVARMFDPFFSTKHDGHGLGLAAMLGIVQGHRGAVRVYSEVGKGTTVRVLLPAASGLTPAEPTDRGDTVSGTGRILVVDDEEQVRAVTKRALESAGYEVVTANDGQHGLEVFSERADEWDLVLLDMSMPHLSGRELFRELRVLRSNVRIVMMSGYNEQEAINEFSGRRYSGFIQKPFEARALLKTVRDALSHMG